MLRALFPPLLRGYHVLRRKGSRCLGLVVIQRSSAASRVFGAPFEVIMPRVQRYQFRKIARVLTLLDERQSEQECAPREIERLPLSPRSPPKQLDSSTHLTQAVRVPLEH